MHKTTSTLAPTRLVALAALVTLAAGCVTAEQLDARVETWIGRDADDLAAVWGAPSGNYQRKDGGRILSYERTAVVTAGTAAFADTFSRYCRVDFTVDQSGKIQGATWQGSAEQCNKMIVEDQASDEAEVH